MPTSKVYFSDLRASFKENLLSKLGRLMDLAGLKEILAPYSLVAIKIHFGERGNTAFVRPVYVRQIVDCVRALNASPFLTDTNTLYGGTRGNSVSHLATATQNGFAYSVVNAPVIIADGIRGASFSKVRVNAPIIDSAYLAKEIVESDALVSVAHFKGHELSGFAGTIKNLGMGCASRRGKLAQHSDLSPKVKRKKCIGCGECVVHCTQKAVRLTREKASIDPGKCVGCGECIPICAQGAINVRWSKDVTLFQRKMVEYCCAVLKGKKGRSLFLNFLTNISPACDCNDHCDAPIVHDIGITASRDPVAIDQASVDLVNLQRAAGSCSLKNSTSPGQDKFRDIYPNIDWSIQLNYAEILGLGNRDYELITI